MGIDQSHELLIIKRCTISAETDKAVKVTAYLADCLDEDVAEAYQKTADFYQINSTYAIVDKWIPKKKLFITKEKDGYSIGIPRWLATKNLELIEKNL